MKRILTSFAFVAAGLAFAQVGVNAGDTGLPAIAKDAVFQVSNKPNEKKGVLLPSVSLKGKEDKVTTSNGTNAVTTGLMVWNDGKSGLTPAGYYYWDGAKWVLTGNVEEKSSTIGTFTHFRDSSYTLKSDDTVVVCDSGSSLSIIIPQSQFVAGRNFVALNNSCRGGVIFVDEQGNNVLSGNSVNADIQSGIGQHLYYDGNKWFNTTGY